MTPQIHNQESLLRESTKHFLTSYNSGTSDFSSFDSIFFRLIQTMLDPPLEISWFYSAVTFHSARFNPSTRVLVAKDMLNLLISCSNLSSAPKRIALLAPVVYELYNIVHDCRQSGLCVNMEINDLIDNLISYVTVSTAGSYAYGNGDVDVVVCFEDLVRVWTVDRGGGSCNYVEILKLFFPLLTDGTRKAVNSCCGIHDLAGIVLCEVFFLKVCLNFSSGMLLDAFLKESIMRFRNGYFLDILLKMLLEARLPVSTLLSSEDEMLLLKALYDAIMLIDDSIYSVESSKRLAMLWLLTADRAIQFARSMSDQERLISYLNAFRESKMMGDLTMWASVEAGIIYQNTSPDTNNSSPQALIKWLLFLEDQGIRIFDHDMLVLQAKEVVCRTEVKCELLQSRKRKESSPVNVLHESRVKQMKHGGGGGGETYLPFSSDYRSEVKSIATDEEMEVIG